MLLAQGSAAALGDHVLWGTLGGKLSLDYLLNRSHY
jgi:hypothetical protein